MSLHGDRFEMEPNPPLEQQERLRDFLTELKLLSMKYGFVIDGYEETGRTTVVDAYSERTVGMELTYMLGSDSDKIAGYDFLGLCILDGVWPVTLPDGTETTMAQVDGRAQLLQERMERQQTMRAAS